MFELEILKIAPFSEGYFVARNVHTNEEYVCSFREKERLWDNVYNHLNRPMIVYGELNGQVLLINEVR
jgi:hypothetical protein